MVLIWASKILFGKVVYAFNQYAINRSHLYTQTLEITISYFNEIFNVMSFKCTLSEICMLHIIYVGSHFLGNRLQCKAQTLQRLHCCHKSDQ